MPLSYFKFSEEQSVDLLDNSSCFEKQNTAKFWLPKKTYYANTEIFSERIPERYPKGVGKLSKNVFDDDR